MFVIEIIWQSGMKDCYEGVIRLLPNWVMTQDASWFRLRFSQFGDGCYL